MRPPGVFIPFLLCALACSGGKSPEEQLVRSVDGAASWVPALQMTAEKWSSNSVPSTFAKNAAGAAEKELQKAQAAVATSTARRDLRDRLAADLRQASDFAGALQRAAERDDPRRIVPAIRTLAGAKADLDAIRQQYGAGS